MYKYIKQYDGKFKVKSIEIQVKEPFGRWIFLCCNQKEKTRSEMHVEWWALRFHHFNAARVECTLFFRWKLRHPNNLDKRKIPWDFDVSFWSAVAVSAIDKVFYIQNSHLPFRMIREAIKSILPKSMETNRTFSCNILSAFSLKIIITAR